MQLPSIYPRNVIILKPVISLDLSELWREKEIRQILEKSSENPVGVTRDTTFVPFSLPLSSVKTLILIQPLKTEVAIYTVNASTCACT